MGNEGQLMCSFTSSLRLYVWLCPEPEPPDQRAGWAASALLSTMYHKHLKSNKLKTKKPFHILNVITLWDSLPQDTTEGIRALFNLKRKKKKF